MPAKSLEIRINSVDDAKAVVQNCLRITQEMTIERINAIDFVIAHEVQQKADALIRGVFRVKTTTSYIVPKQGNALFILPHLNAPRTVPFTAKVTAKDTVTVSTVLPKLVPLAAQVPTQAVKPKKRTWSRKPKAKAEVTQV